MAHDNEPPWPGFVDALSSVLMMMIFFTLILVLVVAVLSYMTGRKDISVVEETETTVSSSESMDSQSASSSDQLKAALTQKAALDEEDIDPEGSAYVLALEKLEEEKILLQKQLKESQARIVQLEASRGKEVELRSGDDKTPPPFTTKVVKALDQQNRIIILYNQLTSTLEEPNKVEMLKWINANMSEIAADGLSVVATLNLEGVPSSTANTVSFKRLYGLIRIINEEGGVPKSKIKFRTLTEAAPGSNQVMISVDKSALQ